MSTPEFDRFVEASRLTSVVLDQFVNQSEYWDPGPERLSIFDQPGAEIELPSVQDRLQKLFASRRSERVFNDRPLSARSLAEVLAAAGSADGRSVLPSAGGLEPIQTYAFVRRGPEEFDGHVVRYLHRDHSVASVASVPTTDRCRQLFSLDCEGNPALMLAFVVDPALTLGKYGERGGRFLLQQVGHAMQNVGLRLADSQRRPSLMRLTAGGARQPRQKLHGYILGGVLDEIMTTINLAHTRAVLVGGYAVGVSD